LPRKQRNATAVALNQHDKQLIERARNGDTEAFAEIFEQYRPLLHSLAYRLVGANDCEDVVMDTYLKMYHGLAGFRGTASLKTWLCRILHNCATDYLRQSQRRESRYVSELPEMEVPSLVEALPDSRETAPDRMAADRDLGRLLRQAMAQLNEEQRTALLMREADGLSYREIAVATGAAVGTVMSRLFHAKRKMQRTLREMGI
jgi:RNA polymerase sigma-70 factor (ECF subfamily)